MSGLTQLMRTHPLRLLALILFFILLAVAALWWQRDMRSEPSPLQVRNVHEIQTMELRLERLEVLARLQALKADIVAERDPEELERRLERIRNQLEPAYRDVDAELRQEMQAILDELSETLRRGYIGLPDAFDTAIGLARAATEGATGERQEGNSDTAVDAGLLTLVDAYSQIPPPGGTLLRVIHAAPGQPALNLRAVPLAGANESGSEDETAASDDLTLIPDLAPRSSSPYLTLPAGVYGLQVMSTGNLEVLLEAPDLRLEPGAVYTLFLFGTEDDSALEAMLSLDALLDAALGPTD